MHLHKQPVFGARKSLQRDFDADAGSVELHPQEITRAFLNLISNSFYAATKRKTESAESDFEAILTVSAKNLGSAVEVRIRDNGNGIPAVVQEKMFNPFFTTKPAGERTGLGLSMTDDIIAKQHGGRIDVLQRPNHVVLRNLLSRCRERQSCKRHPLARIDYAHSGCR